MVDQNQTRASGKTAGEEIASELTKNDEPDEITLPTERAKRFRAVGLSRMSTEWSAEDQVMIDRAQDAVNKIIDGMFHDYFRIVNNLYDTVREPDTNPDGSPRLDDFGWPMWKRSELGGYVEDWTKLRDRDREKYVYQLSTMLGEWEAAGADLWAEAMYAKGAWEDAFSAGYESLEGAKHTVDARTARGRLEAQEQRYFAIFKTHVSRRAEGIVRAATVLNQRLKDTLPSR